MYRHLIAVALLTIPGIAYADDDVMEVGGEYLANVRNFELLSAGECKAYPPIWKRSSEKAERWVLSLLPSKDQGEFSKILPQLRSMMAESSENFLRVNYKSIKDKYRSTEQSCAYAYGFIEGLIIPPETKLSVMEHKMKGRVTVIRTR